MFPVSVPPSSDWLCSQGILSWKFPKKVGSYTLLGRSRAADATCFFIPELDLMLDCGCAITSSRPKHIFITHGHSDHCAHIHRVLSRTCPPQIVLPKSYVEPMSDFIRKSRILFSAGYLNEDSTEWMVNHQLIGVEPDEFIPFRNTMKVRVFEMDHSVPCCGYGFYDCRQKLKKEYASLPGKEIAQLRKENPQLTVSEECFVPQFAFLCDTTASIFKKYQDLLFEFPLLIVECSFLDHEQHAERADDVKHVIWDDLQPFVIQHPEVIFILIHFSHQYKTEQIKKFFTDLNYPNVIPFI